jgi:TPR repeat protein
LPCEGIDVLGGVFISYRREDSAGFAGRIYDRLTRRLEAKSVFLDVDNIQLGLDFVDVLSEKLRVCDALIAIIGKNWNSSSGEDNGRRLDDPDDFVRIEIEAALQRGIRVIPVLVDGATMPKREHLPESLQKLRRRQAIEISHNRFDSDVERLTHALSLIEEELRQREAAEAERIARQEREQREATEAARMEEARQKAGAEAARRSEQERWALAAAENERIAREERERQNAAEAARAEEARQQADAEAARLAEQERRAQEAAEAERAARSEREWRERIEAAQAEEMLSLEDCTKTFERYRMAAERGTPDAQTRIGDAYTWGWGAQKDHAKAMEWYWKAAYQGHPRAQVHIGKFFSEGQGVQKDYAKAVEWYRKAVDQGVPFALYIIARLYETGGPGLKQDYAKAMKCYREDADRGWSLAQYDIGRLYENGLGVPDDLDQARTWYQKAADQGSEDAKRGLRRMEEAGKSESGGRRSFT